MKHGWYQVGFASDFEDEITAITINEKPFMIVRQDDSFSLYNATCPHRGANLAKGGRLADEGIYCPFHGCLIGLDCRSEEGYEIKKIPLKVVDGLLFTKKEGSADCGFETCIENLSQNNVVIPGFKMTVNVAPELVIENAFDQMHFRTVHRIMNEPVFEIESHNGDAYAISGTFVIPPSPWQSDSNNAASQSPLSVPYEATAFSPYVVISQLKGSNPYYVITSARKIDSKSSMIYLSIAIPDERFNEDEIDLYKYLIQQSYQGLEMDSVIWENIDADAISRFQSRESSVIGFQKFCKRFS